jgi:hypothetical protein
VSTRAEVVRHGAERDQEALRVLSRFEALQDPFTLTRRQVRVLSAIVQPLVPTMLTVRQCSANRRRVAGELVGDHHPRLRPVLTVEHTMQETFGGYLIASVLDQDVQHDAVLVNGSPQPVASAAYLERHLVQMPLVAGSRSAPTQPPRIRGAELGAPLADGLVANADATLGEQILNVTETEVETKVQPHSVSDDLRRETVSPIKRLVSRLGGRQQVRLIADPRSS